MFSDLIDRLGLDVTIFNRLSVDSQLIFITMLILANTGPTVRRVRRTKTGVPPKAIRKRVAIDYLLD